MAHAYSILDVSDWLEAHEEALGSKAKVWLRPPTTPDPDEEWLFKIPRSSSGEHWAEKIAAEIAARLEIPHARVELANRSGTLGSASPSFAPRRPRNDSRALTLGNELLHEADDGYQKTHQRPREHTVELVLRFLGSSAIAVPRAFVTSAEIVTAADVFVGYLLLDALIGNTDRHHENWGVLVAPSEAQRVELAPSFDHASSLGRELGDDERQDRITTNDQGRTVERYCARGRSPLFASATDGGRAHSPRSAFESAARQRPAAARAWLARLQALQPGALHDCVHRVPSAWMTDTAREFTTRMLDCNREHLLGRTTP